MTPIEEEAVRLLVRVTAHESVDEGILCAVEMIRLAAEAKPEMSLSELADRIESAVSRSRP